MPKSIQLLKDAKSLVQNNSELKKIIDVIDTGEEGSDWVIRGFDELSVPLKGVLDQPAVIKARQDAIELLTPLTGATANDILKKLTKNSANLHWSFVDQKILIIDMQ